MASRLALQHRYPEPPARIYAVIIDPHYLRDKLRAVGGPDAKLLSREQDERGVTIVLQHGVPAGMLPAFLRSALPRSLIIRRTEIWTSGGGSVYAQMDGAPGSITGTMRLNPDHEGCVLEAELVAEIGLPLLGVKLEKLVTDGIASLLAAEHRFTLQWLRNGAGT
jgi:hypothetical protein